MHPAKKHYFLLEANTAIAPEVRNYSLGVHTILQKEVEDNHADGLTTIDPFFQCFRAFCSAIDIQPHHTFDDIYTIAFTKVTKALGIKPSKLNAYLDKALEHDLKTDGCDFQKLLANIPHAIKQQLPMLPIYRFLCIDGTIHPTIKEALYTIHKIYILSSLWTGQFGSIALNSGLKPTTQTKKNYQQLYDMVHHNIKQLVLDTLANSPNDTLPVYYGPGNMNNIAPDSFDDQQPHGNGQMETQVQRHLTETVCRTIFNELTTSQQILICGSFQNYCHHELQLPVANLCDLGIHHQHANHNIHDAHLHHKHHIKHKLIPTIDRSNIHFPKGMGPFALKVFGLDTEQERAINCEHNNVVLVTQDDIDRLTGQGLILATHPLPEEAITSHKKTYIYDSNGKRHKQQLHAEQLILEFVFDPQHHIMASQSHPDGVQHLTVSANANTTHLTPNDVREIGIDLAQCTIDSYQGSLNLHMATAHHQPAANIMM